MTDMPSPPPGWAEAAVRAGTELGLGGAFAGLDPAEWDRVCRRAGQILVEQGQALPPGWERAMAHLLGRAGSGFPADDASAGDFAEGLAGNLAGNLAGGLAGNLAGDLARDSADAVLAERGEVFAPEDDA